MLKVLDTAAETDEGTEEPPLDELAREGARRMLMTALAAEVAQYVETHQAAHDEAGRRLVVRNGRGKARKVTCGAGTLAVQAPRVNDKRVDGGVSVSGSPVAFSRRTCGALPRSPRCCRFCICAGCRRGTSARRCPCCSGTTRPA